MAFELTPASTSVTLTLGIISALLIALALTFAWFAWTASHISVAMTGTDLELRLPLYGRRIPISSLDLAGARVVDVDAGSTLRPVLRTNGIGLPGYGVGWFRLESGEKALLAMTSRKRALYIPTAEGYALLLSLKEPDRALGELRATKGAPPVRSTGGG